MSTPRSAYAHSFWWAMFSQGGILAAFTVPALILAAGILGPLGVIPYLDGNYKWFSAFVANWLGKLFLFVVIALPMFHVAHRLHFWLHHLGVHAGRRVIPMVSYAAAVLITVITAVVLVVTP